ncbi:hypothetical protein SEUCBS139899_008016 [Sporothrix eucalyptigena]|uniref:Peptidase S8/S53 domain-containing protein n=1 Tax=Sporothrix eucalyptigena TaxID=1812306 RepID=A0ABP0BZW2_9PEZI
MALLPLRRLLAAVLAVSAVPVFVFAAPSDEVRSSDIASPNPAVAQDKGFKVINPNGKNIIQNAYIAVYKTSASPDAITSHQAQIANTVAKKNLARKRQLEARGADSSKVPDTKVSNIRVAGFRAMSLKHADDDTMRSIYGAPEIDYIEQDGPIYGLEIATQGDAQPGLSRLSHAEIDPSFNYEYDTSAGYGATVYILDSGIQLNVTDFQGRAVWGTTTLDNFNFAGDDNGHGTYVAGIVGGRTYGVAKNVALVSVRVLDGSAYGTKTTFLDGVDWIYDNITNSNLVGRAVVLASMGTDERSESINGAVDALVASNITFVAASGNDNDNSTSHRSPASAAGAITVGAIDATNDNRASFSSYGPEVTVYAAGVNVLSTSIGPTTFGTTFGSGTSSAAPHVAGLAAYLIIYEGITSGPAIKNRIIELASLTNSTVHNNGPNTTNLIANNGYW